MSERRRIAALSLMVVCALGAGGAADVIQNPAARPTRSPSGSFGFKFRSWLNTAKQGNVDLLLLGDSITDFWKRNVLNEYFAGMNVANFGLSGDRCEHVLWHIQHGTLKGLSPDVVMVMVGTNNIKSGDVRLPPRAVFGGVQAIVNEVLQRLPETKILLMGILPRQPRYDWIADVIRDTNRQLKTLAAHDRVWFMDIGDQFLGADGLASKELMPDLLHPNEAGYRIWARSVVGKVNELMDHTPTTSCGAWAGNHPAAYPPIRWCPEHNLRWTYPLPGAPASDPVLRGQRLFVALGGNGPRIICLEAGSAKVMWECPLQGGKGTDTVALVATDTHVFATRGAKTLLCCDAATGVPVTDVGAPAIDPAPTTRLVRDGRLYILNKDGTLQVRDAADTETLASKRLWEEPSAKETRGHALWATAEHLYARAGGAEPKRVVLTLGADPQPVWSYQTEGTLATDTIGEFLHVVGDGKALHAFGGKTHRAPSAPVPVVSVPPVDTPSERLPLIPLQTGVAITSWVYSVKTATTEPSPPAKLPDKGLWKHERFTAGMPAVDLMEIYDRKTPAEFTLATVLHVTKNVTVGWELMTPCGGIWNRPDRVTGVLHLQDKPVPADSYIQLAPGYYEVTIALTRAAMHGAGKIWIGPRFVEAPSAEALAAERARHEAELRHWKSRSEKQRRTFLVGATQR